MIHGQGTNRQCTTSAPTVKHTKKNRKINQRIGFENNLVFKLKNWFSKKLRTKNKWVYFSCMSRKAFMSPK